MIIKFMHPFLNPLTCLSCILLQHLAVHQIREGLSVACVLKLRSVVFLLMLLCVICSKWGKKTDNWNLFSLLHNVDTYF